MATLFLIKKPIVTEKASDLSGLRKYVFMVEPHATKNEVKKAVHEIYKVDPVSVNIISAHAKKRRYRGLASQKAGYKKAVVTLPSGQKIDVQ